MRNDDIRGVAADIFIGIAGRCETALVIERGLNDESVALFVFLLPFCADLYYFAAELVTDYNGVFRNVCRNSLVCRALIRRFMSGHTDTVRYDMRKYLVLFYFRKLEFFKPEVVYSVKSYSLCSHFILFPDGFLIVFLPHTPSDMRKRQLFVFEFASQPVHNAFCALFLCLRFVGKKTRLRQSAVRKSYVKNVTFVNLKGKILLRYVYDVSVVRYTHKETLFCSVNINFHKNTPFDMSVFKQFAEYYYIIYQKNIQHKFQNKSVKQESFVIYLKM